MTEAQAYVGTSGWSYPGWVGTFYPRGLPQRRWLAHYCRHFPAVELNASFYRYPSETAIAAWNRTLPEAFHLVVKGHRRITHLQRLQDVDEELRRFCERIARLRHARLVLWQLPPSWRRTSENVERLRAFLAKLPARWRHAVELRHPSWWEETTEALLRSHTVSFVAVSHPRLPAEVRASADVLYVRFHGLGRRLYDYDYSEQELSAWVERLRPHLPGRSLYAFFNNTARPEAVANAQRFAELLRDAGVRVARPPEAPDAP